MSVELRHFGLVDDELPSCSSLDPDDEDKNNVNA